MKLLLLCVLAFWSAARGRLNETSPDPMLFVDAVNFHYFHRGQQVARITDKAGKVMLLSLASDWLFKLGPRGCLLDMLSLLDCASMRATDNSCSDKNDTLDTTSPPGTKTTQETTTESLTTTKKPGEFYKELASPLAQAVGLEECKTKNTEMASYADKEEKAALIAFAKRKNISEFWLPYTNREKSDTFQFDYIAKPKFDEWESGQPKVIRGLQMCVVLNTTSGLGFARDCSTPHRVICEVPH